MPGLSASSGFSTSAYTSTVRVVASTCEPDTASSPVNTRPGNAGERASTRWPTCIEARYISGAENTNWIGSTERNSAIGVPGLTSAPTLTRRRPTRPSNGAVTV